MFNISFCVSLGYSKRCKSLVVIGINHVHGLGHYWFYHLWIIFIHHKLAPSMYMCFYNTLTMCSRWRANEMLIQSLIWYCDNIITHCDDWSLYYNVITTSSEWLINTSLTLNLEHIVKSVVKTHIHGGGKFVISHLLKTIWIKFWVLIWSCWNRYVQHEEDTKTNEVHKIQQRNHITGKWH
jgi:hypothetical protein